MSNSLRNSKNSLILKSGALVGAVALIAAAYNSTNHDSLATSFDAQVEQAYQSHDEQALSALGIQQVEQGLVVRGDVNVRTTPEKSDEVSNISSTFSRVTGDVVILENPIIYDNPNDNNGKWYGAKDENGNFVWVNENVVQVPDIEAQPVDVNLVNAIYISPKPENNK